MVSTRTASSSTTRILRAKMASCCLTKTSTNIIFRFFLFWSLKDLRGGTMLNKLATEKEASKMRNAGSLLHIMRYNNNSILFNKLGYQFLDLESCNGIKSGSRFVHE